MITVTPTESQNAKVQGDLEGKQSLGVIQSRHQFCLPHSNQIWVIVNEHDKSILIEELAVPFKTKGEIIIYWWGGI